MRVAGLIARYLLGLIFLVFGANGFLHFIPMPPPPGVAGQFMGALFVSHVLVVIFLLELIGGHPAAGGAVCSAGAGAAGSGDREHRAVSRVHGAEWIAAGYGGGDSLAADGVECARRRLRGSSSRRFKGRGFAEAGFRDMPGARCCWRMAGVGVG